MKISIIVPVYNAEKYLREALNSLVNQTLKDIEIICVNDGSTDKSTEIIKEFATKDPRVKLLSQANLGQSAARNAGLNAATGEYIGFLDADDWGEINAFEALYSNALNADICIGSINVSLNGKTITDDPYLSLKIFPQEFFSKEFSHKDCSNFLFRICVTPWNKIYKRELLNNIRFKEGINFEDNIFFLETFLAANSIRLAPSAAINYRVDSTTSYSHGQNDSKKLDFFKVLNEQEKLLKRYKLFERTAFELHKKSTLLYWYKKIQDPKIKLLYQLKLIKEYPSFLLSPFSKLKTSLALKKLPQDSYIWLDKNSENFLKELLQNHKIKIKGFVSTTQNTEFCGIKVINPKEVPTNSKIFAITKSYYKYNLQIEQLIKRKVENLLLPLW